MEYGDMTIQDQAVVLPNSARGSFTKNIGNTTASVITGIGFKPRVVIFWGLIPLTKGMCMGFFEDGSGQGGGVASYNDVAGFFGNSGGPLVFWQGGANQFIENNSQTVQTDGFTLGWSRSGSPVGTATIYYLALK